MRVQRKITSNQDLLSQDASKKRNSSFSSSNHFYNQFYDEESQHDPKIQQILPFLSSSSFNGKNDGTNSSSKSGSGGFSSSSFSDFRIGKLMSYSSSSTQTKTNNNEQQRQNKKRRKGEKSSNTHSSSSSNNMAKYGREMRQEEGGGGQRGGEGEEEILDLLSYSATNNSRKGKYAFYEDLEEGQQTQGSLDGSGRDGEGGGGDDDDVYFNKSGKLVIKERKPPIQNKRMEEEEEEEPTKQQFHGHLQSHNHHSFGRSGGRGRGGGRRGGRGGGRRWRQNQDKNYYGRNKGQRSNNNNNNSSFGGRYKAKGRKTTGGDVMRKGMKFEPYAYLPLSGQLNSKKFINFLSFSTFVFPCRNRRQTQNQYKSIFGKKKR